MRGRAWAVFTAGALALGSHAAEAPRRGAPEVETEPGGCLAVTVAGIPAFPDDALRKGFSARRTVDLGFQVTVAGGTPDRLTLRLFTPNGHLYQQVDVPVAATGSPEEERALPGYPFPLKVVHARPLRGADGARAQAIDAPPFPVAGTTIVTSSLYGRWHVEASTGGTARPCSATFGILP